MYSVDDSRPFVFTTYHIVVVIQHHVVDNTSKCILVVVGSGNTGIEQQLNPSIFHGLSGLHTVCDVKLKTMLSGRQSHVNY